MVLQDQRIPALIHEATGRIAGWKGSTGHSSPLALQHRSVLVLAHEAGQRREATAKQHLYVAGVAVATIHHPPLAAGHQLVRFTYAAE